MLLKISREILSIWYIVAIAVFGSVVLNITTIKTLVDYEWISLSAVDRVLILAGGSLLYIGVCYVAKRLNDW
jgi:hypothetical protein